jgi:hypothetical protein
MIDRDIKALLGYGAKIVPVQAGGKVPIGVGWQSRATSDEAQVAGWLARGNIGICLGHGGLIDIEYDDHPAYESWLAMETVDGRSFAEIDTPVWESHRGRHHLFRLADTLPAAAFRKLRGGVEARFGGKAAQSVLPPSTHPSGMTYRWLARPSEVAPAVITLADLGLGADGKPAPRWPALAAG